MGELVRCKYLVRGKVQKIGYRKFIRHHAIELGLKGYAKNLRDGRVEICVEGDENEIDMLYEFIIKPPRGRVTKIIEQPRESIKKTSLKDFERLSEIPAYTRPIYRTFH